MCVSVMSFSAFAADPGSTLAHTILSLILCTDSIAICCGVRWDSICTNLLLDCRRSKASALLDALFRRVEWGAYVAAHAAHPATEHAHILALAVSLAVHHSVHHHALIDCAGSPATRAPRASTIIRRRRICHVISADRILDAPRASGRPRRAEQRPPHSLNVTAVPSLAEKTPEIKHGCRAPCVQIAPSPAQLSSLHLTVRIPR